MFDLLSLSVASLNVYFNNTHKQSRRSNTTKTLLVMARFIIIMSKTSGILVYYSSRRKLKRLQETCRSVSGSFLTLRSHSAKFERVRPPPAKFKSHKHNNHYSWSATRTPKQPPVKIYNDHKPPHLIFSHF
jgi:hypothetical protein